MKKIIVNRGEYSYEALVDDEDYEFLAQHRWRASVRSPTLVYANASVRTAAGFKSIEMHRMVIGDAQEDWQVTMNGFLEHRLPNDKVVFILPKRYTRFRKLTVDHIDGDGLNNTRANLRHLSCAEQIRNRRLGWPGLRGKISAKQTTEINRL